MEAKFSQRVKNIFEYSREEAMRLKNDYIGVEHLFLGLLRDKDSLALKILEQLNCNFTEIKNSIERNIKNSSNLLLNFNEGPDINIPLNKQAARVSRFTHLEAQTYKAEIIRTEHLLLAILKDDSNIATKTLNINRIDYDVVSNELRKIIGDGHEDRQEPKDELPGNSGNEDAEEGPFGGESKKNVDPKSKTPVLDNFGRDLTRLAEEDRLDPVVGCEGTRTYCTDIKPPQKKQSCFARRSRCW